MSQQELERVEVIALRQSGHLSQAEAARRLGVTERQVRRLEARVVMHGAAGLRSARRGRPSNRRIAPTVVSQAAALIRAHYRDFGPTLSVGMQNSPLVGIEFSPPIIDREIADGRESSGGRGSYRRTG